MSFHRKDPFMDGLKFLHFYIYKGCVDDMVHYLLTNFHVKPTGHTFWILSNPIQIVLIISPLKCHSPASVNWNFIGK